MDLQIYNLKGVLRAVLQTERAMEVKEVLVKDDRLPAERALGIMWDVENDELKVRIQIPTKPQTKRGLLSMVSSIYDPLRLISPSTIRAKTIFQDEFRQGSGWDEQMTEHHRADWWQWLNDLPHFSEVSIPRCYHPECANPITMVQLHHFCDASQQAYGAVSYLRITSGEGAHSTSFVCSRAKLAPLKQQTIPRLELCATVLAAKADKQLREELELQIDRSVFWTDSMVTLQYIRNTERRFHTFVAYQIAKIHKK
ncbi:uncharacterized protein LOC121865303 [Homarus americanus]|uniref:uncharacterized protein LOC121865303 n=1 Tax=Homarus americanus TaxID=6706 RepID=UPI001C45850F|nr:uncharacterized protein LOC121865303 [Homarus americanus]